MEKEFQVCLALDGIAPQRAFGLSSALGGFVHITKIHEFYHAEGPYIIRALRKARARRIWIDAKVNETPVAAAQCVRAFVGNGADIVTVYAGGGIEMMKAAVAAAFEINVTAEIWAVPLLSSLGQEDIDRDFGQYGGSPTARQIVLNRTSMAQEAGIKTIVCSAEEIEVLSGQDDLREMRLVAVGTRSPGVSPGVQKRSGTPKQAVEAGAKIVVVGSEVTAAPDPIAAFERFLQSIAAPQTE